MYTTLLLLLVLPSAEPNEAEKLFRQMEAKVLKAKTLECTSEAKIEASKEKVTTMGKLFLGEGNKVRMEMNYEFDGMKRKITLVADGTKMIALVGGVGPTRPHEVPKWLGEASRNGFARGGAGHAFGAGPEEKDIIKEFKADEQFAVADFKLGKKEMVNQQEAQVVEYTLTLRKSRERKFAVSVWIDTKTQLPFKHALTEGEGDNKATVTETYSKVTVDEKIDPKQFELPKE